MIIKNQLVNWVIMTGFVFTGIFSGLAQLEPTAQAVFFEAPDTIPVTTITVDSGLDPTTSKSETCATHTPCTLRRAIVQARLLAPSLRPVLIRFDIPQSASEGYDSSLGIWKLHIKNTTDPSVFRYLDGGSIIIDGSTQPGGTTSGPKIFIVGPSTNQDGLLIGSNAAGGHDGNEIRGLAFQNFKNHMIVNSSYNLIEGNWFGLSDDGMEGFLRNDDPEDGSGSSGIALSAGVTGNNIQNNSFLGFDGVAVAIRGDENTFGNNHVGIAADGTTPGKQTNPSLVCTTADWLGGGGISLEGDDHIIENNIFAGLRQEVFKISTQPDAIRVTGTGHLIQDNQIGLDNHSNKVGVCGRGIFMSDSPQEVQLLNNIIVDTGLSGISLNGILYDENTLRSNTIEKSTEWPEVEGNPEPENAIQVGASMTDEFKAFKPAKVTDIDGTAVSGISEDSSPCPNCIVEVFLDDTDSVVEALQSLAVVTANLNGTWSATLPFELSDNQGLRTTSTTAQYNTIPFMSAGTTTALSELYTNENFVYIPLLIK
jgi:parallel beta-helix repeat protein